MKNLIVLLAVILVGSATVFAQENKEFSGIVKMEVKGLSCPFCAYGLEKNLKAIPSIEKISINIEEAFVEMTIKKDRTVSEGEIKKKVKEAGFTAGDIKVISNE